MSTDKQVFQTESKRRWYTFKWITRISIIAAIIIIAGVAVTLYSKSSTVLPKEFLQLAAKNNTPDIIKNKKAYEAFKLNKQQLLHIKQDRDKRLTRQRQAKERINAAFYVNWSKDRRESLARHISSLDMVVMESLFLKEGGKFTDETDTTALKLVKHNKKKALAIVSNFDTNDFKGAYVHELLADTTLQNTFINNLLHTLKARGYDGVNIDFEELQENNNGNLYSFQQKLYNRLHSNHMLVTIDMIPENDDYDTDRLATVNDYIFIMAYDQHAANSLPGEISNQEWVENIIDKLCRRIDGSKFILSLACYGYDWPAGKPANNLTYSDAITLARAEGAKINYNPVSANSSFEYINDRGIEHTVFFTDAVTNFNLIRRADDWGLAGIAIWRLGSEDERLWHFINRSLTKEALAADTLQLQTLKTIRLKNNIQYTGEGEVLDLISEPVVGKTNLVLDKNTGLITQQDYTTLPSPYIIKRFGYADKKVVLTFDDGPDPNYTPRIIDILQREKVPAAFFDVGVMIEKNVDLVKKEYDLGYEIGNHTYFHPDMSKIGQQRVKFELNSTRRLIESITGHSTILFRAPFNADAEPQTTDEILPVAQSRQDNYINIGESIDPQDWQPGRSADQIFNEVVKQQHMGNIILLHDAGGNREATIAALPRIIQYFKSKGYTFTSIGDLIQQPRSVLMPAVKDATSRGVLAQSNWLFINLVYYGNIFLNFVFTLAIILAVVRIAVIAYLAYANNRIKKRNPTPSLIYEPYTALIVPAYNEEVNIVSTINNLLKLNYGNYKIVVVDDGSNDNTYALMLQHFSQNEKVVCLTKPNGGKASALNYGIAATDAEYVVCIDADTQLNADAIGNLLKEFTNEKVGAVAGTVKVGNTNNILTKWQSIEYTTSQNMDRRAFELLNTITVVPGAIGAFKTAVIKQVGAFTTDTLAEDCDLTMRILKAGYLVKNSNDAVAYTEVPETLKMLTKQRFRWTYGVIQSFWKNRDALFNKRYSYFGMVGLPNILIFQIMLPLFAPLADLFMLLSIISGLASLASVHSLNMAGVESISNGHSGFGQVLMFYLLFIIIDLAFAMYAFILDKTSMRNIWYIIPQRFFWRQLMYVVLFKSIGRAIKGESSGWGVLKRTGNVKMEA